MRLEQDRNIEFKLAQAMAMISGACESRQKAKHRAWLNYNDTEIFETQLARNESSQIYNNLLKRSSTVVLSGRE